MTRSGNRREELAKSDAALRPSPQAAAIDRGAPVEIVAGLRFKRKDEHLFLVGIGGPSGGVPGRGSSSSPSSLRVRKRGVRHPSPPLSFCKSHPYPAASWRLRGYHREQPADLPSWPQH